MKLALCSIAASLDVRRCDSSSSIGRSRYGFGEHEVPEITLKWLTVSLKLCLNMHTQRCICLLCNVARPPAAMIDFVEDAWLTRNICQYVLSICPYDARWTMPDSVIDAFEGTGKSQLNGRLGQCRSWTFVDCSYLSAIGNCVKQSSLWRPTHHWWGYFIATIALVM